MKTTVNDKFLTDEHRQRFQKLVNNVSMFGEDINYTSAGYLLSADADIFRKALPYMKDGNGINFARMKKREDFTTGQWPIVCLAREFYTNGYPTNKEYSLTDLVYCDTEIIPAVFNAILLYLDWDARAEGCAYMAKMLAKMEGQLHGR